MLICVPCHCAPHPVFAQTFLLRHFKGHRVLSSKWAVYLHERFHNPLHCFHPAEPVQILSMKSASSSPSVKREELQVSTFQCICVCIKTPVLHIWLIYRLKKATLLQLFWHRLSSCIMDIGRWPSSLNNLTFMPVLKAHSNLKSILIILLPQPTSFNSSPLLCWPLDYGVLS